MPNRRSFLLSTAATAAAAVAPSLLAVETDKSRKRIAMIATQIYERSHGQHFLDRLAMGYAWNGQWLAPQVDLVSLYVDQITAKDLSQGKAKKYGIPTFKSIDAALTLGTGKLAVDGVVIVGEHGDYPHNAKGQTLYPRYEFFKQVVKVYETSGRSVPVFSDKHLSTEWKKCTAMVADSRRLGFPFMAGSSLPVTRRLPEVEVPWGCRLSESLCVGYGRPDSYDFHGLETAQCMSERRRGGEVGIKRVQALRGSKMWQRLAGSASTQNLLGAALTRSHTLPAPGGYESGPVNFDWARRTFPEAFGYFIEHRDGFRTTYVNVPIHDFNYAGRNDETGEILSCQMYLPFPNFGATTADFFNPLIHHLVQMVLTGQAPYPIERTLLTSGMVLSAMESLYRGGEVVETPEMEVKYFAPKESMYWRG